MTTRDIFHRLRVGLALLVGFLVGKSLGEHFGHHASEFFIGGFMLGFLLTHAIYWIIDRTFSGRAPL
ncbi:MULTISPECIES: hypothetical protein [Methylococcus]|uniref:Uncharacterized protein n=1 Tax=Methylococcus capsulatus TaxID=414 RepID=A0ABZ2F721_METCP|nr:MULTISPECIES: hypothetical protein [Methylococcus]MDF9393237.1 hypothetical protein [Methylococcus capsulatus]